MFIRFNSHVLNLDQVAEVGQVEQYPKGDRSKYAFALVMSNGLGLISMEFDEEEEATKHRNRFINFLEKEVGIKDSNVFMANKALHNESFIEKHQ